jgi:hypothetical protein
MSINTAGNKELGIAILNMAEKCTTIPECPRSDSAIRAIADDLAEFCRDLDEALSLVNEARRTWDKWQGSAGLKKLLEDNRSPRPELQTYNLGPKPTIRCDKCHDWGTVDDANGENQYCDCPAAEYPRSIRLIERFKAARAKIPRSLMPKRSAPKVITQSDIDHAVRERNSRNERTIASARAQLADLDSTSDQIAMAKEILRNLGAEEAP